MLRRVIRIILGLVGVSVGMALADNGPHPG